jgi:sugar phosphate isomerase/epimerase
MSGRTKFSVFTKFWRSHPLPELGKLVADLGFDGVELPVRPGFQVEPAGAERDLPAAARILADFGLEIMTVAATVDERMIAACAAAGVPVLRDMVSIPEDRDYLNAIAECQRGWEALVPALESQNVALGIQNHCFRYITHAMHLYHALAPYDPRHICAVWDAGHNALQGEDVELALDVVWSHLRVVNMKNAFWQRTNGPEAEFAQWQPIFTTGRQGLADWPRVFRELERRDYRGPVCLCAEYTDAASVDRLVAEDLAFAKQLVG